MAAPGLTVAAHRRVQIRAAIAVVLALPVLAAAILLTDAGGSRSWSRSASPGSCSRSGDPASRSLGCCS